MTDVYDVVVHVLGLEGKIRGDEYDFSCPVHADRHPSAGINLQTGLWKCLGCGAGGNLVSLAMAVKGIDRPSAKRLVRPHTPEALVASLTRQTYSALNGLRRSRALKLPGPYPPEPMDYLRRRGFNDATLKEYEAGYVEQETFQTAKKKYSVRDYIALPVRDASSTLLFYVYRAAGGQDLRYLYTPGAPLSSVWFGANLYPGGDMVVVTEGALDSMWVSQCGYPAIAALGGGAEFKTMQLTRYRSVVMFMDRDAAGVHFARGLGAKLVKRVPVKVARYPRSVKAKDPADLSEEQVCRSIERAIPYTTWERVAS